MSKNMGGVTRILPPFVGRVQSYVT